MPIFEFICPVCGGEEEVLVLSKKDNKVPRCQKCNKKMKKIISENTFHLKGSGWYKTDYGTKKKEKKEKEEK